MPRKAVIDYRQVTMEQVREFAVAHGFTAYAGTTLDQPAWVAFLQRAPADQQPAWATLSQLTIVPFYDRTGLIYETLDTLKDALTEEILITVIVILLMVMHLRSSLLISMTLPLTVLVTFIGMKVFQVDANIVALSGIAIAIGTIVDMGIIMCENILNHLEEAPPEEERVHVIFRAASEVGSAVVTAIATTIVGFLPVFAMIGAEGKLFKPLAFTKTFCLFAAVVIAITIVPALAHLLFAWGRRTGHWTPRWTPPKRVMTAITIGLAVVVMLLLATRWQPLGFAAGYWRNAIFVFVPVTVLMVSFAVLQRFYQPILRWLLAHKLIFLSLPVGVIALGALVWLGTPKLFGWLPHPLRENRVYAWVYHEFPGLGKEFMPPLDEGSFLYMPTTMAHASIGEAQEIMRQQDLGFENIPEIESAVGKLGRAESPLDPAPTSMVETVINYFPEYLVDEHGSRRRFRFDPDRTDLARDVHGRPALAPDGQPYTVRGAYTWADGQLVEDPRGRPFRAWRPPLDP